MVERASRDETLGRARPAFIPKRQGSWRPDGVLPPTAGLAKIAAPHNISLLGSARFDSFGERNMDVSSYPPADIRRLWHSDAGSFRDHLLRLDPLSRRQRYGGGVSDDFLVHYAESCFGQGDLVYGAFIEGVLRGAAELRSQSAIWSEQAPYNNHVHAEAAFSVEEGFRRRGLGEQLFSRVERAASNHGVETIEIVCLPDNIGMRRLAAKFSTRFAFEENSLTGRLTARRPTPFSLMREATGDVMDFGKAMLEAQWRALGVGQGKSG
jgi:RimJ/RimL family protein N-acetyltransferase